MRALSPISLLALGLTLSACSGEDTTDDKQSTPTDPDPLIEDTGTTTDTGTGGNGNGNENYLDPESVELPDPSMYDYSASVTIDRDDVIGGYAGQTAAEDPSILCDRTTCPENFEDAPSEEPQLFAIDSDFGHWVQDFYGAFDEDRDGDYDDGFIGDIHDLGGTPNGVQVASVATKTYQAGYPRGSWCGGLGGDLIKCSSEHFVSMEHALTCYETIPYYNYDPVTGIAIDPLYDQVCEELDLISPTNIAQLQPYGDDFVDMLQSQDYAVTLKDDGKYLYRWGTWEKEPTDVRLYTTIELPSEWKSGDVYRVTRAELAVVHTITNSPNDQIRPEELENEAATGRKPGYDVQPDGTWTSNVDCYESDGDFIPAGTVLKNPDWAIPVGGSADLINGFTNAWYTTLDRDPFDSDPVTGSGPRWRLKSPKFGQDIPGIEISTDNCAPPPTKKDFIKYPKGELTATVVDLLDWVEGEDSPLLYSTGWTEPTIQDMATADLTVNGIPLTEDFDLALYVKGEYQPTHIYKAVLYLDYELAN